MIKTTLKIEGMMCPHCEAHMNEAIEKFFTVSKVTSSHAKKETVIISEAALDKEKILEAVATTSYKLIGIESEPYKKGIFGIFKK